MEKLAKVRKFFFRYRFIFILAVAAVLALTATLMGITGTVTDADCPDSFIYGNEITYTAGAIMQDVYYEYSTDGITWTTDVPTEIGDYQVRAVSKGIFGTKRTGSPHAFSILPQQTNVYIAENKITYGDLPTVRADLSYEDTITCSEFIFEDPSKSTTKVTPKESAIKILNKDGEDVTSSYNLNIISSDLTLEKRFLTIKVSSETATYSASPLTVRIPDGYEITEGSLSSVFGDTLICTLPLPSITNVGSVSNELEFHIINSNGVDVTDRYNLIQNFGKLTVEQKLIYVTTPSNSSYYDGTVHEYTDFMQDGLVDGHQLVVESSTKVQDVNGEGVENALVLSVKDGNGEDISANYSIVYTFGTLTVTPRPVTIKSATESWIYDGQLHSAENTEVISELKLAGEDTVKVVSCEKITDCSTAVNRIVCNILSKDKTNNTFNYKISYEYGNISIEKRVITIKSNSKTFEYDGTEHFENSFVTVGDLGIANGQKAVFTSDTKIKEVGNLVNLFEIKVEDGEKDVTSNYTINYQYGAVKVEPRVLTVTTPTASKTYDGTPLSDDRISADRLAPNQTIKVLSTTSITDVFFDTDGNEDSIDNLIVYRIEDAEGKDVIEQYDITYETGTLTLLRRPLSVTTESKTFEYTGEELSWTGFSVTGGTSLASGETAEVVASSVSTIKNVSESGKDNQFEISVKKDSTDTTANYLISYTYGKLSVTQKSLTVVSDDDSKEYDGTALTCSTFTSEGLISEHSLNVVITGSQTDAGTSSNTIESVTVSDGDEDVTDNYDIETTEGALEVTKRAITVTTASDTWTYDDEDHQATTFEITSDTKTVSGETAELLNAETTVHYITDGTDNILTVSVSDGANDKTSNYDITYVYGTLTVLPKEVSVTTYDASFQYDKEKHSNHEEGTGYSLDGIISGHTADADTFTEVIYAVSDGTPNEITFNVKDASGNDVTENYSFVYVSTGTITITARQLSISTPDKEFTYNGEEQYFTEGFTYDGLISGDEISIISSTGVKDVITDVDNEFTVRIGDEENDATLSYDIVWTYGTLSVTAREITFTGNSISKIYDGTPLTAADTDFTTDNLVEGHTAEATVSGSLTDKGTDSLVVSDAVIYDADGNDVTSNYDISYTDGTITVTSREIEITTLGEDFTYDAEEHTFTDFEITSEQGLASGHSVVVSASTVYKNVVYDAENVTYTENEFTAVSVTDGVNDVTANYTITYVLAKIKVLPKEATLTADDNEKTYDGTALNAPSTFTVSGLISGHSATAVASGSITDAGTGASTLGNVVIKDSSENNVTSNYDITCVDGVLTVTKKDLTITTVPTDKIYDGTPLSGTFTTDGLVETVDEILPSLITLTSGSDAGIQEFRVAFDTEGKAKLKITKKATGYDSTGNYNITFINGNGTISKRPITIKSQSDSKPYDGTPLYNDSVSYEDANALLEGHEISVTEYTSVTEIGSEENALTIVILDKATENDVTANYDITEDFGILTILGREIEITVSDLSLEYNAETQGQTDTTAFTITDGELAEGHIIITDSLVFTGGRKDIGTYSSEIGIDLSSILVQDEEGNDYTNGYTFTIIPGTLEITKRTLEIVTESQEFVYDGEEHSYKEYGAGYHFSTGSLLEGHSLTCTSFTTVTDVAAEGTDNVLAFSLDPSYADLYNFSVSDEYGTLTVTPRPVTITTGSLTSKYNKEYQYSSTFTVSETTPLVTGHAASVSEYTKVTDVTLGADGSETSVKNLLTVIIKDSSESDVTANYSIEYITGELLILRRTYTITTLSAEKVYDGEYLEGLYTAAFDEGFVPDNTEITTTKEKNAGIYTNDITSISFYRIVEDSVHEDVSSNYNVIIEEKGTLTISARPISFVIGSTTWNYDGTEHSLPDFEEVLNDGVSQLVPGHTASAKDYVKIKNVSRVLNSVTIEIKDSDDEDVTDNYIISVNEDAYLEITKISLSVRLKNAAYEYSGEYYGKEDFIVSTDGLAVSDYILYDTPQLGTIPGEYTIFFTSLSVMNVSGEDATSNYDITEEEGTLTILKRKITVESEEWHDIYEAGKTYNHNVVKITSGSLVSGHILVTETVTLAAKYTEGTPNEITLCEIVLKSNPEEKLTEFYEITKVENLFYIGNPFISFTTLSKTVFLDELEDGQALVFNDETAYKIDDHLLSEDHHIVFSITGSQTGIGSSKNTFTYSILDGDDQDVSALYEIKTTEGTLTIKKRTLEIITGSGTWIYDGNPHSSDIISLNTDELKEGYRFCHEDPYVTITEPGTVYNTVAYWLEDSTGARVSDAEFSKYYSVNEKFGELTVSGLIVIIQSASDSKDFDETPLTNPRVDILFAQLRDGDVIDDTILTAATGSNTGTATETTTKDNTVDMTKFKVTDGDGNDVTALYSPNVIFGKLTVYATDEEEKDEQDEDQPMLTVLTTAPSVIYLKINAYGSYAKTGFIPFNMVSSSSNHITVNGKQVSADYIASLILEKYGKDLNTATITSYLDFGYPLPYYMDPESGTYQVQTSDAAYTGNSSAAYTVGYYTMTMSDLQNLLGSSISLGSEYESELNAYNSYVHSTYLGIDTDTKQFMDGIIKDNDLNNPALSLYQKIAGVASYIQASADYSLTYDMALDSAENVAIAFLSQYKSGICKHFATAATMLYRALGIPARFVEGFVTEITEANTPVDITFESAHAWVEVYIDNYGWFQVEVTGGERGHMHEHGEESPVIPPIPDSLTITVKPKDVTAQYDGVSHTASVVEVIGLKELGGIEALRALGYDFTAMFRGEGTVPGIYESEIIPDTFHITKRDPENPGAAPVDITSACSVTYEKGTIEITKRDVTIVSSPGYWPYDGEIHTKNSYTLKDGSSFVGGDKEFVECISSIKELGEVDNDFIVSVSDKDGNDASSYYNIIKEFGKLQIVRISVILRTGSASKIYDGEPLTKDTYSIEGNVLDSHQFLVTVTGTITDIGKTLNTAEYTITDKESGEDVSRYYAVNEEFGELTVAAKIITVKSSEKAKFYDGTPLAGDPDGYEYSELPAGYTIKVTITGKTKDGNAQTAPNTFTVQLFDANSVEDTSFEIDYHYGDLIIMPKNVTLTTASKTGYYDGKTALTCPEYVYTDGDGLISGHSIYTATNWTSITEIPAGAELKTDIKTGEKYYEVTNTADFIVMDGENHDMTANYNFQNTNYGKLKLYKKFISVTSGSDEKEYDGTPLILDSEDDTSFFIDDTNLFEGHRVVCERTGEITEPGRVPNAYTVTVLDEDGNDVTYVYTVNEDFGTLTVTKRNIILLTFSAEKKYDGTPLTCDEWEILSGSVLTEIGHILRVNVYGSATEKSGKNSAAADVYMMDEENEIDLSDLYNIVIYEGDLTIILREITITSPGLTKVYDGTPLTNGDKNTIQIKGAASLEPGHTLEYDFDESSTIKQAGSVINKVTYRVIDGDNNDVTYLYKITENFASLVVTQREITIRTGSKKSTDPVTPLYCDEYEITGGEFFDTYTIEVTGSQTGYGQHTNTYEVTCENKDSYLFKSELGYLSVYKPDDELYASIYSTTGGDIFLKETSFGEYTGTGFAAAQDYSGLLDSKYSMIYLPSVTIGGIKDVQSSRILAYKNFAMPYYPVMEDTCVQTSDTRVSGSISGEYDINFYSLSESELNLLIFSLGSYYEAASAYRTYVYDTYLAVPDTTKNYLESALALSSINKNSASFISDVVKLVKNAGEFDPDYNKQIDSASNMVATFVSYKKGVSRHFASLATLVFRMFGVPARYTEGAYGTLTKNAWTDIYGKTSFVEIFVDGLGWVPLNVTPEAGEVPDIPEEPEEKTPITIRPVSLEKAYDGITLTAANELVLEGDILNLQLLGYTWEVTVEGSQFEKGESDAVIKSFKLYDIGHNDVTDKFDITFEKGTLRVTNVQILIYLYDITEAYDGTAHIFPAGEDVFWDYEVLSEALSGKEYTITFDKSKLVLTNAGCIDPDVLREAATIMDGDEDVTDSFYLVFDGDGFTISRRKISITSGSSTKSAADTSILINDTYSVGMSGLAAGDSAEVTISGVQNGKGTSPNTISGVLIKNASGDDVTASYDITLIAGTLTLS
ncbi:MAG: hypothetical protein MJ068_00530 [Clostridia bacterium]|nr:hypothetical protein [Clostridia bacterium]